MEIPRPYKRPRHATFDRPYLNTFTHLENLELEVTGQHVGSAQSMLACPPQLKTHGTDDKALDSQALRITLMILRVTVSIRRCQECAHV